jgi:hypothetical protein
MILYRVFAIVKPVYTMDVNRFWRSVFKNILHEIEVIED